MYSSEKLVVGHLEVLASHSSRKGSCQSDRIDSLEETHSRVWAACLLARRFPLRSRMRFLCPNARAAQNKTCA
jgi:hypothetical protein